jgi:hypothetical protein
VLQVPQAIQDHKVLQEIPDRQEHPVPRVIMEIQELQAIQALKDL